MADLRAIGAVTVGDPVAVPFATHPCPCVKRHSPTVDHTVRHHVLPLAWGGEDVESNVIAVCPNTHSEVHRMLEAFVREGGPVRRPGYTRYAYKLALQAWEEKHDG
jgi:hypothetical protein